MREAVLNNLLENGEIENICSEYGEQGYTLEQNKKAILFANWNNFDKYPNFMEWIEENYEIEWSDEWIIDYNESKAYRTSPNSYGWQQQVRITDCGELITPDSDIKDWIDYCVMTDYKQQARCLPDFIDEELLIEEGFKLILEDNANGWYGRADDPNEIAENVFNETNYTEILFVLDSVGQFEVSFSVYVGITPLIK